MIESKNYRLSQLASIIIAVKYLVSGVGAYSIRRFSLTMPTRVSPLPTLGRLHYRKDSDVAPTASPGNLLSANFLNHTVRPHQTLIENETQSLRLLSTELGVKWLQGNLEDCDRVTPLPFVILERVLDTAEDAFLHLRRLPYDWGWRKEDASSKSRKKTVVVLGSGWGAHAFLKVADTEKIRVIVVSPTNHFVFTPMLAGAAVGTVVSFPSNESHNCISSCVINA